MIAHSLLFVEKKGNRKKRARIVRYQTKNIYRKLDVITILSHVRTSTQCQTKKWNLNAVFNSIVIGIHQSLWQEVCVFFSEIVDKTWPQISKQECSLLTRFAMIHTTKVQHLAETSAQSAFHGAKLLIFHYRLKLLWYMHEVEGRGKNVCILSVMQYDEIICVCDSEPNLFNNLMRAKSRYCTTLLIMLQYRTMHENKKYNNE